MSRAAFEVRASPCPVAFAVMALTAADVVSNGSPTAAEALASDESALVRATSTEPGPEAFWYASRKFSEATAFLSPPNDGPILKGDADPVDELEVLV